MEENEYKALLEYEAWLKDAAQRVKEGEDVRSVAEEAVGVTKLTRIDLAKGTRVEEGREGILDHLIAEINRRVREDWGDELHCGFDEIMHLVDVYPHRGLASYERAILFAVALTIPPREAAESILEKCQFCVVEGGQAMHPTHLRGEYAILLEASCLFNVLWASAIHLILHETAHVLLGHIQEEEVAPDEIIRQQEREANILVAQWMRAVNFDKQWAVEKMLERM